MPPAGRLVQASVARYTTSPGLGMVTDRGCWSTCWILLKAWRRSPVQEISSFPDLLAGICSSSSLDRKASLAPGRQISLNLTAPSQPLRPRTVLGGSHMARGSSLWRLGEREPLCQLRPKMSAFWMFNLSFDGLILRSADLILPRIVLKRFVKFCRLSAPK